MGIRVTKVDSERVVVTIPDGDGSREITIKENTIGILWLSKCELLQRVQMLKHNSEDMEYTGCFIEGDFS